MNRPSVRPEFRRLAALLLSIRDLQGLFVVLFVISALRSLGMVLLLSDPLLGDGPLPEALSSLVLTALILVGGTRLAFEPFDWSLTLALSWSAWALFSPAQASMDLSLGWGLWASVVRTLPFARFLQVPNTHTGRRIAGLQGRSGAMLGMSEQGEVDRIRSSKRAWRRCAVGAGVVLGLGIVGIISARSLRPEEPLELAERFLIAWNQGGMEAVESSFGAEVTDQSGRAPGSAWPALGPLVSWASQEPGLETAMRRGWVEWDWVGRTLALEFSLADDSGSILAAFDRVRGGWHAARIDLVTPCVEPTMDAFAAAWDAGEDEGLLTLCAQDQIPSIVEDLQAARDRGWPSQRGHVESRGVHASAEGIHTTFLTGRGAVWTVWTHSSDRWHLDKLGFRTWRH